VNQINLGAMDDGPYSDHSALQATSQARQNFGMTHVKKLCEGS